MAGIVCAAVRCLAAGYSVRSSRRGWGRLLRPATSGAVRARSRRGVPLRLFGGLCAAVLRLHRQRLCLLMPSPRRGRGRVHRRAGRRCRVVALVRRRSAPASWHCVPGTRRQMPHLQRRPRWRPRHEASVLRGECVELLDEASVPSTDCSRSSAAVRRRTNGVHRPNSATRRSSVTVWLSSATACLSSATVGRPAVASTASSMTDEVSSIHPHWLLHRRGIEDEKKRGDGDQLGENWGRSHSALACQGESLASS